MIFVISKYLTVSKLFRLELIKQDKNHLPDFVVKNQIFDIKKPGLRIPVFRFSKLFNRLLNDHFTYMIEFTVAESDKVDS